jgi:hypothetical protein
MAHIELDVPSLSVNVEDEINQTRVILRQPTLIINQSEIPIYEFAENALFAITASYALNSGGDTPEEIALLISGTSITPLSVLANSFTGSFTGSFFGDGNGLIFTTLSTSQSSDSQLIVGNRHNDYQYKQTTVFRNGDVVVSGSTIISENGYLILTPQDAPATIASGGLFFSSSGELFVGI